MMWDERTGYPQGVTAGRAHPNRVPGAFEVEVLAWDGEEPRFVAGRRGNQSPVGKLDAADVVPPPFEVMAAVGLVRLPGGDEAGDEQDVRIRVPEVALAFQRQVSGEARCPLWSASRASVAATWPLVCTTPPRSRHGVSVLVTEVSLDHQVTGSSSRP